MNNKKEKIWVTKGFFHTSGIGGANLGYVGKIQTDRQLLDFKKKFFGSEPLSEEDWIEGYYAKFGRRGSTIVKDLRDVCVIPPGLQLISQRCLDLLQDFETGKAEFRKMPIYGPDAESPLSQSYYTIRLLEKPALMVAEESVGLLDCWPGEGRWQWPGGGRADKIALRIPAGFTLDIWIDRQLPNWVFVSNRLKEAIKENGIKGYQLSFKPCRLLQ